jgi:tetratricopeptide (TPR) repeat protein
MAERQENSLHPRLTLPLRWLTALALLLLPAAAVAEIRSADACGPAIAADPALAREDAAVWSRMGGGLPARLCEAEALSALGAHATAAQLLTRVAESPNRAMTADLRATILGDAAAEWLDADRPDLARAVLLQVDSFADPTAERLMLRARAEAGVADWPAAQSSLEAALGLAPDDALAQALLAATLRQQDDALGAVVAADRSLRLDPDLPEALFEAGAARAETGDVAGASQFWLELLRTHPDSPLAAAARTNLQRLN